MKRFLAVLVASMFLTSAAYAADAIKGEKGAKGEAGAKSEKGAKGEKGASATKATDTKAGAMGDVKKSETATEKTADKPEKKGKNK